MRLPLFWLTDYVDPGLEPFKLADRLDMTGTTVERIHTHGVTALENFVVGRVLDARTAPGRRPADASARSRSARATSAQIVCGAPNVAAGQTVARRARRAP